MWRSPFERRPHQRPDAHGTALGLVLSALVVTTACAGDPLAGLGDDPAPTPLSPGETRTVELRHLRLDVEGFERTLTLDELRSLPRSTLSSIWVMDLPLAQLVENAMDQVLAMDAEELAEAPQATRNLHTLLSMTPDDANLEGTSLEELISLSGAIGIPPAKALANLMGIGPTDRIVPIDDVAAAFVEQVVASHPAAQVRPGPVDDEHPDGLWPVAPGTIPVTLDDVAFDFETLPEKFGPTENHPGIVEAASGVLVAEEDFRFTVKVSAQALPFKGVELPTASVATVNSKPGQIEHLFDFTDPSWLSIDGLVPEPRIGVLTQRVLEYDGFVPGGTSRDPAPRGDSPAWDLDPWLFEALIAQTAYRWGQEVPPHCDEYELGTGTVAFRACVEDDGWVSMETFNDVGAPPPPSYLWDLLLEIAQVRLHDGGLSEGEADIEITVRDVAVGIGPAEIVDRIRTNIEENPAGLTELVRAITDNTEGDADFYYVRTRPDAPADVAGDYLFFVTEDDLRRGPDGAPVRGYDYERPGFYADPELTEKVSATSEIDGDTTHEKVRIEPGDVVYAEDAGGTVYRIEVRDKPSLHRIRLDVTRLP
ncbi:MAG: acetyltransferase [Deltaproteobacteria bacterium]|nr:MAG: acetyltransferase [Deltaproteobacteria bacterium]